MDDLVIGDVVHWFVASKTENKPCAAMVLDIFPSGMVTLAVFHHDGQMHVKNNVWPIGHKTLVDNPDIAVKHGAWRRLQAAAKPILAAKPEAAPFDGGKPELPRKQKQEAV